MADLFVEQAVPIAHITGEEGAVGTADAVILRGNELIVVDLKYGMGVEVSADNNPQLMLYALGALETLDLVGDIERVRMVIVQPRISRNPSEFTMSAADLVEWGEQVAKPAAEKATEILWLAGQGHEIDANCGPHPDACRFCKAKPTCPALSRSVQDAMGAEFTDLTTQDKPEQEAIVAELVKAVPHSQLGAKMDAVDLVEMWAKAIRGETERQLLAGLPVPGYKLVQGRKGARAWKDTEAAEKMLKSFRLKNAEMYDFTVISPTTAEKKFGAQPKRWTKLCELVKQADGKPSVAPIADKRPALEIKPVADEFETITEPQGAEDLV